MLVSIEEFRHALGGVSMSASQKVAATQILSGRQQDLENYINRPLEPVLMRQALFSDFDGSITLLVTPVHQVLSMEMVSQSYVNQQLPVYVPPVLSRPTEITTEMRKVDLIGTPYTGWQIAPGGLRTYASRAPFLITYIGGYRGYVDDAIKQAIITVAKREYRRQFDHGIGAQGGRAEATQEADPRPDGWTLEEKQNFDRIRRRTVL